MLSRTYYAGNDAGVIDASLASSNGSETVYAVQLLYYWLHELLQQGKCSVRLNRFSRDLILR